MKKIIALIGVITVIVVIYFNTMKKKKKKVPSNTGTVGNIPIGTGSTSTASTGTVNTSGGSTVNTNHIIPSFNISDSAYFNKIEWGQIPDFDIPLKSDGKPIKTIAFFSGGRNQLPNKNDIWKKGITMLDFRQMEIGSEITDNYSQPFTSSLPQYRRAFFQIMPDSPLGFWNRDNPRANGNYFSGNGGQNLDSVMDSLCFGPSKAMFQGSTSDQQTNVELMLFDLEPTFGTGGTLDQDWVNQLVFMQKRLNDKVSGSAMVFYNCEPVIMFGKLNPSYYTKDAWWSWSNKTANTSFSSSHGFPSEMLDKSIEDNTKSVFVQNYDVMEDWMANGTVIRDTTGTVKIASLTHHLDGDRHWLHNLLGGVESNNRFKGNKKGFLLIGLTNLDQQGYLFGSSVPGAEEPFPNYANGSFNAVMPKFVAQGKAAFALFSGYDFGVFDSAFNNKSLTPTSPNSNPTDLVRNRSADGHFFSQIKRMMKDTNANGKKIADAFDGTEIYLNQNTEVSYNNGTTWVKPTAYELKRDKRPTVRAVVNTAKRLFAVCGCLPYGDESPTDLKVKYGSYVQNITLVPNQIFLSVINY